MERFIATMSLSRFSSPRLAGSRRESLVARPFDGSLNRLEGQPGVIEIDLAPSGESLTIAFDRELVSLADLVWLIEDSGADVSGVSHMREERSFDMASA